MAQASDWLQTAAESRFIHVPVACIHEPDGAVRALAGRTLRTVRPDRVDAVRIDSLDEYRAALTGVFKLDLPGTADLWPEIVRRQEAYDRQRAEANAATAALNG
jgi:arylamine N-acetyltransferase